MSMIEISRLTKDYGGGRGVFDLSFTVEKGEVFGFLGPNGAGKTTTIRHLMGFLTPQSGCCRIDGLDCAGHASEIQRNLGYIPGEIAFFDEMTGDGFIRFLADYRGLQDLSRAQALKERFELDAHGRLKKMSKGMKQKIGIVCAFMHDPAVLILDEPTSGLDPLMQNRFVELIQEEKARGKTILMSSHMFEEVERTCDRVAILKEGRLAAVDSVAALKKTRRRSYTVVFPTTEQAAAFAAEWDGVLTVGGRRVTAAVQDGLLPFLQALERYGAEDLDADRQSLEDVFMQYYGGGRP
ncbi:MAG: ABC transporter ATP-binding protein [Clostridiales bacterium]|nr:ABC transporter ATP-binding protein [Clostridiales bacterium]